MKRKTKSLGIYFIIFSMLLAIIFSSCKAEQSISSDTTVAVVDTTSIQTTSVQTTAEETTAVENLNEPDAYVFEKQNVLKELYASMDLNWKGPEGETPTKGNELMLTKTEVQKLKEGNYTYAVVENNLAGEYSVAVNRGVQDLYEYLGIKQIAFTSAEFDPSKQKSDIETVLALKPSIVIGHPTDPVTAAENFKPIVDAGIPLANYDTKPQGYTYGKEIVGISVNDGYGEGILMADEANRILGDNGKLGYIFYDDVYYICNMIDKSFLDSIEKRHPTMQIVEKVGYVAEKDASDAAAAIIQTNPDVQGLFATYMVPAMYAVGACLDANRKDIAMITFGIDMPVLLDLINGGNVKSVTTDMPYYLGFIAAMLGVYGLLEKEVPGSGYFTVPNMIINQDNMRDVWNLALNIDFPKELDDALKKIGK